MRHEADGTTTYFPLDYPETEVAIGWYLEMSVAKGNIMAMVFRDGPDKPWKLVLRTRLYKDDLLGRESRDERNGYMVEALPHQDPAVARQELTEKVDGLFGDMMALGMGRLYRLADHTSTQDFLRIWGEQPWGHMTPMTQEEIDQHRGDRL